MSIKPSFTVRYRLPQSNEKVAVLGVTSIVPNLNGVLLFTEDGRNHQIESSDMMVYNKYHLEEGHKHRVHMDIEYSTESQIRKHLEKGFTSPGEYACIDGRAKN